jgi:hypothetical protein
MDELQKYVLENADEFEDIIYKRPFLMTHPGCDRARVEYLKSKIPSLPQSYLDLLKMYSIAGIEINGFSISPCSFDNVDIVEGIIQAYEDPFFPKDFMEKHKMYQIGSHNTDQICITAGTDEFKKGEILFVEEGYDIYNPQDSQIRHLAQDFEEFLLVSGNFAQVERGINEDGSNVEEKKLEFMRRLRDLNVAEEYQKTWLWLF